jgi:hypothetical protein
VAFEIIFRLGDRQDGVSDGLVGRSRDVQTSSLSWTARRRFCVTHVFIFILLVPAPVPSRFGEVVRCRERSTILEMGVVEVKPSGTKELVVSELYVLITLHAHRYARGQ